MLGSTDYDSNKDNCLRSLQSYSVILSNSNLWVPDERSQDFHFEACSSHSQNPGQVNLGDIPTDPDMLLLEASALDSTLAAIA